MGRLDGKVAIITGGAQGMGAAESRLFAAEGASVVVADVADDAGETVAAEIGERARFVHLDVTDEADWAAAVSAAEDFGPLTVLVNNAAVHWTRSLADETADGMRRMLEVNLIGTFHGIQAVMGPMGESGGGSIVNISSIGGTTGLANHGAYGSSKWAVRGLTKIAALELGPSGIRVNSVHPGPIESGMLSSERHGRPELFGHLPLQRAGAPSEVADLVLYLASDQSSYQTGGEYIVDGGSTAGPALRS